LREAQSIAAGSLDAAAVAGGDAAAVAGGDAAAVAGGEGTWVASSAFRQDDEQRRHETAAARHEERTFASIAGRSWSQLMGSAYTSTVVRIDEPSSRSSSPVAAGPLHAGEAR
jgi:hypothetical protein